MWIGFVWLGIGTMMGPHEHNNELLGSIKMGNFLTRKVTCSYSQRSVVHKVGYFSHLSIIFTSYADFLLRSSKFFI